MTKSDIISELGEKHESFIDYVASMNEADFVYSKKDKWTAGQQLQHILLAVKPLAQALSLPKFLLKIALGKANRPSKSYEELVQKYVAAIENGGKASKKFIPLVIDYNQRDKIEKSLRYALKKMLKNLEKYSEEDLDIMVAPHPLLGKLTLREMLFFTAYHVEHHHNLIQQSLVR